MKTNQLMHIAFSGGDVEVFHKTAMGNLTQLWNAGNKLREKPANLSLFLSSNATKRFIEVAESKTGGKCFEMTGTGNKKRTWASIHLMIYAAEYLSPEFHFEVIDTFINGKILDYRDESGDEFKAMNIAIDKHLPDRENKDNTGVRIQIAKKIKHKVNPELTSWNLADADDLRYRLKIEEKIVSLLELGVVNDYEHLKQLIGKM
jgi:hypothetical protein